MFYEQSQEGNDLDDTDDLDDPAVTIHLIKAQRAYFKPHVPLSPNDISSILPKEARESLVAASKSGDSRLLESTISRIKAKYPKYFKLVS